MQDGISRGGALLRVDQPWGDAQLAALYDALAFDEMHDDDSVFEDKGIRLLVDRPSLPYVKGSVIDFVEGLQGAGFQVDNPNVIAACGCGSSFRVAEEEEVSAV